MSFQQDVTKNQRQINGPSVEIIRDTDDILNIDTTLGPVTLTLQNIRISGLALYPRCIYINDVGNNAAINNIIIFASGGDIVNNGPSVSIQTNGANAKCNIANQTEWSVQGVGVSTSGITGVGTINRIAKFTAPNIIGDSLLFDNGVSVGIGTITPNASALFDLTSLSQGVLLPRMTLVQRNAIVSPATSLLIFDTTTNAHEYYDGSAWQIIANRNDLQTYSPAQNYAMFQDFDLGVIPAGWTQSTSLGTVVYTQAYESGAIGQVLLSAGGPGATRASIGFATTYNYILNFTDAPLTKWNFRVRRPAADNGFCQVGLSNSIAVTPTGFGSSIVLRSDRLNQSGQNPGLIQNWFVLVKIPGAGFTVYDTGVAPTGVWQYVEFEYDNSSTTARVRVKINGVVVASVPSSNVNLFTSSAPGAGLGLFPCIYCGTVVGAAAGNTLRIDNFNILRKWN